MKKVDWSFILFALFTLCMSIISTHLSIVNKDYLGTFFFIVCIFTTLYILKLGLRK